MKKIAIFCDSLSRGGAERVTIYLASYFSSIDVECDIITFREKKEEYKVPANIKRFILSKSCDEQRWKYIGILRKIIFANKYEAIIVMGLADSFYVLLATLLLPTKIIVSERNDPIHFNGSKIIKFFSRFMMRFADGFVFQTKDAKNYFAKTIKNRGIVIANPLIASNLPTPYLGIRKKSIINLGRLDEQKNQKLLIKVFGKLLRLFPDYILEIYGEGCLREELQKYIDTNLLKEKVFLRGNRINVWDICKDAALFVMTSNYEGMPNALIEAMAMGLPCVSVDCPCGGPRELIKDRINGFLIKPNDEEILFNTIKMVLDDYDKYKFIGNNAITVRDNLSLEKIGGLWNKYLISVLDNT